MAKRKGLGLVSNRRVPDESREVVGFGSLVSRSCLGTGSMACQTITEEHRTLPPSTRMAAQSQPMTSAPYDGTTMIGTQAIPGS